MRVYLALGSNLGDREHHLRCAIRGLMRYSVEMVRSASIYLSEPRDVLDQPWFFNTVVQGSTSLDPEALLRACLRVEQENLRHRQSIKGPRTLDIDIIFYETEIIRMPGLIVPHPRFSSRRFVIEPLAEIASEFIDPVTGVNMRRLAQSCTDRADAQVFGFPIV